jgi:hypothetical protein
MHEQGCVRSIATSAAAAPRRYSQVAEWLSRAQDTSKPPWSTAGQQHAREHVASTCMPCATHLKVATATARYQVSSRSLASLLPGLGPTPSATTCESHTDCEKRGASAQCKVPGRSRIHAGDVLDAGRCSQSERGLSVQGAGVGAYSPARSRPKRPSTSAAWPPAVV